MYEIKTSLDGQPVQSPALVAEPPRLAPRPALPVSGPTAPRPRPATSVADSPQRMLWLLVVLSLMVGIRFAVPRFAEEIQYSITRGRERAQYDQAGLHLADSPLSNLSRAYRLVSKRVSPSVVHINVKSRMVAGAEEQIGFFLDMPERRDMSGQGSGVIVDAAGYIVTNYHVIKGASEIEVGLSDGRRVGAQVVGHDTPTDLAVLKIDVDKLIPADWGDSDHLEPGSLVWACGSPFGLQQSITFGILSAKNRAGLAGTAYQDFLQTDAAVNPGNSGGPLVDEHGRVIGINTAIVGDAYQGISFAVPSSVALDVYERLRREGHVSRGWLGVEMDGVSQELADQLGLVRPYGALVLHVVEHEGASPAAQAGIREGDVILRWNDDEVVSPTTLSRLVARTQIGTEASVLVLRSGEQLRLNVAVGQRPDFD